MARLTTAEKRKIDELAKQEIKKKRRVKQAVLPVFETGTITEKRLISYLFNVNKKIYGGAIDFKMATKEAKGLFERLKELSKSGDFSKEQIEEQLSKGLDVLVNRIDVQTKEDTASYFMWGRTLSDNPRSVHLELVGNVWKKGESVPSVEGEWPSEWNGCQCQLIVITKEEYKNGL